MHRVAETIYTLESIINDVDAFIEDRLNASQELWPILDGDTLVLQSHQFKDDILMKTSI